MAAEPAKAWHGVVLLTDTKAMEMKVRPVKADLQDSVKIGQGAIGSQEKAPPEHRVNPANPNVDKVSFGLRILFHYAAQPIRWTTPRLFLAPGLKCSPIFGRSVFHACISRNVRGFWQFASDFLLQEGQNGVARVIFGAVPAGTP